MIRYDLISRTLGNNEKESFKDAYHKRLVAKASGDEPVANALKLTLNSTYGASINQYNDLYDPRSGRSVCVNGQLLISNLIVKLARVSTLQMIQCNTDSVTFSVDSCHMDKVYEIVTDWEKSTGLKMKEDKIKRIVQKDVNNYVLVMDNGEVKVKGGMLSRGISKAGAWNINNNQVIVATALRELFAHDVPVEKTIGECTDLLQFQFIAKSSSKYEDPFWLNGKEKMPIQKVNRIYASKNPEHGTLYHIHKINGNVVKQPGGLPEHCVIDNRNQLGIESIDIDWYIKLAQKRAIEFTGGKK